MQNINTKNNTKLNSAPESPKTLRVFGLFRRELSLRDNSGFSLVEMLVAIGIFMSIMTIAITSLISIMGANKKAQAIKSTVDSVTFALEYISRDMRIGTNYDCFPADDAKKDCTTGSNIVTYLNSANQGIEYKFEKRPDGKSSITKRKLACATGNCTEDLISFESDVTIDNFTFYVIGAECEDGVGTSCTGKTQPRVIVTSSGSISAKGSANTTFNLQTNISQRARR